MAVRMSLVPDIPVVDAGRGGADDLARAFPERLGLILATARRRYSRPVLWLGDRLARRWAERAVGAYRAEYAAVAAAADGPGTWMLNFSYEWGCTAAVVAEPDGTPRLLRTMDWQMPSLGRTLLAIRRRGDAGPWLNLAWPGFVGAVQGLAPGRFAAALNQAPEVDSGWGRLGDWLGGKLAIWRNGLMPPALLLRQVFDSSAGFAEARERLATTPICAAAIFTLAGVRAGEAVVIERTSDQAVIHEGTVAVANHWLTPGLPGHSRSLLTHERLAAIRGHQADRPSGAAPFCWLAPPILNETTRIALEAVPATGELQVWGFEPEGPATAPLTLGGRDCKNRREDP